jgi:2-oxoglutarate dehydrogenase complex dehydrogenase (E1) component-like enzyme
MMKHSHQTSFLSEKNVPYIEALYASYLTNHRSVPAESAHMAQHGVPQARLVANAFAAPEAI